MCTGAQNQRLPFPLLSDAGELLRKNFDIKARDAPCLLPPSLLLAFTAPLGVVVWQCLLWMHRNRSMS